MDIGSVLLGLALLALIAFAVARPFMEKTAADEQPAGSADQLLGERDRVLTQLRDLDFDQAMGKINQEDYAALRAQLVVAGVAILKQLDALGVSGEQPATATDPALAAGAQAVAPAASPADEIEAAVAQRRARRSPARPPAPVKAAARPLLAQSGLDAKIEAGVAQRRAARPTRPTPAWPAPGQSSAGVMPLPAAEKPPSAATLTCGQCGAEVLADDLFCPKCGSAQTIACGHCGRVARAGDQFCAQCGQPLPAADGQASLRT